MQVPQLSPPEALAAQQAGAVLVDVREDPELRHGRIPGALHVPLSRFVTDWPTLPDGRLVMVCAVGARSEAAARFLREQGRDASNLAGGFHAWRRAGLPEAR